MLIIVQLYFLKIHRKNKLFNDVKTSFFSEQICTYYAHFAFDNELVVLSRFSGKSTDSDKWRHWDPAFCGGLDTVELCANVGSHTKFRSAQLSSVDKS